MKRFENDYGLDFHRRGDSPAPDVVEGFVAQILASLLVFAITIVTLAAFVYLLVG